MDFHFKRLLGAIAIGGLAVGLLTAGNGTGFSGARLSMPGVPDSVAKAGYADSSGNAWNVGPIISNGKFNDNAIDPKALHQDSTFRFHNVTIADDLIVGGSATGTWADTLAGVANFADSAGTVADHSITAAKMPEDSLILGTLNLRVGNKTAGGSQTYQWEICPDSAHGGLTVLPGGSAAANAFQTGMLRSYHATNHVWTPLGEGRAAISGMSDYVQYGRGVFGYIGSHVLGAGAGVYGYCADSDSGSAALYGYGVTGSYGLHIPHGETLIEDTLTATSLATFSGALDISGATITGAVPLADSAGIAAVAVYADSSGKAGVADSAGAAGYTASAAFADEAGTATSADFADSAGVVTATFVPDSAGTAGTATFADSAGAAGSVAYADTAQDAGHATRADSTTTVADKSITYPKLNGYLAVRAGMDTARVLCQILEPSDGIYDPCCGPARSVIANIAGQGYIEHIQTFCAAKDSTAWIVIRPDGAAACSLFIRDLAGFPGLNLASTTASTGPMMWHQMGRVDNGTGGFDIEQIIPFADSIKVLLYRVLADTTNYYTSVHYRLRPIDDWGVYSHWHATLAVDEVGVDSVTTVTLFDTGALAGAAVYVGTAAALRSRQGIIGQTPGNTGEQFLERDVAFQYGTGDTIKMAPGTEDYIGGAVYFGSWSAGKYGAMSPWAGLYWKVNTSSQDDVGVYRWFKDNPVWLTDRFRIYLLAPVDGANQNCEMAWRAVSFWYSEL